MTFLAALTEALLAVWTRLGQPYLKQYDDTEIGAPQPLQDLAKQPAKPAIEKAKKLRYNKAVTKDTSEGLSQPFHFNVLDQLTNIFTHITLYELL